MARDFDGVNDRLEIAANANWNFTAALRMAVVWADTLDNRAIGAWGPTNSARGFAFGVANTSGILYASGLPAARVDGTVTTALTAGKWWGVMAHRDSGGNATFRRIDMMTGVVASQTV